MSISKRIRVSTGTIAFIDIDNGLVGLTDASGHVTNYNILPADLYDTDGNRIFIDELRPGDHIMINETGYLMIMRVLKTA
ncbi:hypothetical protein SAMN05660706_11842 [Desulfoscipio geothermicus DSM 3669]|uniref:Uncharacterized protein n=1 Tax=Desulfoscipio geothermicus DSM 3669 TaxID=1121426 RepID=A0A1I6DUU6_9FIRM|nr:hypothetical protein SAMN05660706_11842 [Desulfoscipio geothermicus DSM 3669]